MAPTSAFSRALCVLLVLAALLPPAVRQGESACGSGAVQAAESCCCAPAATDATDCHAAPETQGTALTASDCGCAAKAPPATPPQRAPVASIDPLHEAALPPLHAESSPAVRSGTITPRSDAPRRNHAVSLLRLHCVNLI